MICPVDGGECIDDLCYGGAPVCGADYQETLWRCDECGRLVQEQHLVDGICYLCRGEEANW